MQSRMDSFIESISNIAVGFLISLGVWSFIINPLWGFNSNWLDNIAITGVFTVTSILRAYVLRRWFNKKAIFGGKSGQVRTN